MPPPWFTRKSFALPPLPPLLPLPPLPPPPWPRPPRPPPPWFELPTTPSKSSVPKFCSFTLLDCASAESRRSPLKSFTLPLARYRAGPAPATTRPNVPLRNSTLVTMLMVLVVLPSSKPENRLCSLRWSNTSTLSTISAGRFLSTASGSVPKKGLPSTNTCATFSPCACTLPSVPRLTPGSLSSRSPAVASGLVLKALALNWVVSPFCTDWAAWPVTTTPFSCTPPACRASIPSCTAWPPTVRACRSFW